ncbi:MAG: hypothetical protein ABMA26_26100 [Limisphaerales bacterium]
MSLKDLSEHERQVVFECLRATVEGPFFDEWEFATLFGLERSEVARVLAAVPHLDESDETTFQAIAGSMGQLLGYPHQQEQAWHRFISVTPKQLLAIYDKWDTNHEPRTRNA